MTTAVPELSGLRPACVAASSLAAPGMNAHGVCLSGLGPARVGNSSLVASGMFGPQEGAFPGYNANVVVSMERDWHAIERAYVFGEVVRVRDDGSEERTFPSIRAIAQRFGISRSMVGEKALRNDWVSRRFYFRAALRDATWKKQMADEVARAAAPPRAQ